jgi:hypothetical protein
MDDQIYKEIMSKTRSEELSSVETEKLVQYINHLVNFEGSLVSRYTERSAQVLTINSLLTIRTLEKVNSAIEQINETSNKTNKIIKDFEDTIKRINSKNTILTFWVIILAILTFAATCTQIYLMRDQHPKDMQLIKQEQDLQKPISDSKPESPKSESKQTISKEHLPQKEKTEKGMIKP